MGREKRALPASVTGGAKEKHKRAALRSQYDPKAPVPEGFVAKPSIPKSKHHSYFEFVENKEKKKKLEFQVTINKTPPPGFEFVPIGNPELTTACKELSRGKGAMIFIVSNSKEADSNILAHQVHRIGHHIRETIVEEARASLGQLSDLVAPISAGSPEPIPKSQDEYNAQVDAAIRDLFPRVPHTDRQIIIEHAFRMGTKFKGEKPVGLSEDITLARRVQLAVLAHIRHTHTRYDYLLKETTWQNARKVVESLCLDTLVKWRGDEETGRDQLDEILREVVVISDSEDDDSDEETDESSFEEVAPTRTAVPFRVENNVPGSSGPGRRRSPKAANNHSQPLTPVRSKGKVKKSKRKDSAEKKGQRGFKRYNAWQEALRRYRAEQSPEFQAPPMDQPPSYHRPVARPAAAFTPHEFPEPSELRISSNGAGPAPNENGYVAQAPAFSGHPVNATSHSYSPPHVHDKVMSPRELDVPISHRPIPISRLQDMLVPSIELASPEAMRPSFIRPVPPRNQEFGNGSPRGSGMRHSPRRVSPSRGTTVWGDPSFSNRRVVQRDQFLATTSYDDHHGNLVNTSREQEFVSTRDGYPISASPMYRARERLPQSNTFQMTAATRTVAQDTARPGIRSNPILMEDRGGFFERVSTQADGAHPPPRTSRIIELRPTSNEVRRISENHRIASWREEPHAIRETHRNQEANIPPITNIRPSPFDRPPATLAEPAVIQPRALGHTMHGRDRYPVYVQRPGQNPRPVSGDHPLAHQEPYRKIQHDERLSIAPPHGQLAQQHYMNGAPPPPALDNSRNPRRGFPLHPHRPEDVIVLE